jgi:hypothetical protein
MTYTQTVDIPDNRRLTIEVPHEVPIGRTNVVIQFPVKEREALSREELLMKLPPEKRMSVADEAELFKKHADELNAEAEDVLSYQYWNPEDNE